ncbi:MAG TPA: hypothetical protein DCM05_04750 [Elusimicrobia bacterium]|nr:hypothetical protein [Elusimicrobiota bacterium]
MAVKGLQRHKSVKEILVERKILPEDKLQQAESEANSSGKTLQHALLELNLMTKPQLLKLLVEEWGVEQADISEMDISAETVKIIPEQLARRQLAVPFTKMENLLAFAMADPLDLDTLEDLKLRTGLEVKSYLALPQDILATLDQAYGKAGGALIKSIREEEEAAPKIEEWAMPKDSGLEMVKESKSDIAKIDPQAPEVEKLVNAIILQALSLKASDIHIEPIEDATGKNSKIALRFRVDGVLVPGFKIPWAYRNAIAAKIKIMASLNITERRSPQSGRIQLLNKGNPVEFRVEMLPTVYGEACVMRILDRRSVQVDIKNMGFLPDTLDSFLGLLKGIGGKKNFGLILVCGPTGSGKSTTLYAALNHVNRPDIKIVTAENPVEYNIDGLVQVPVNPDTKLGSEGKKFDFAAALRSFLRFDPDVIMVGEIRDQETAHIAMEAAMTGHLVFSTIHTNDAPSAISRLTDMGLPSFLVAGTLKAVLAQRLSRRLCQCKTPHDPTPEEIAEFKKHKVPLPPGAKLYGPAGCETCKNTGFKGRVGMHELLVMSEDLRTYCAQEATTDSLRLAAVERGMRLIVQDGLCKVLQGVTTVREVLGGTD